MIQQTRQTPTFNMKAVVQETGLKPDTLRAWERRYQVPQPERTDGGHRLYSQRDIDILKWLIDRQDEGMSISHAVDLWRRLEAEGQDPLRMRPAAATVSEPVVTGAVIAAGEAMERLRERWIQACMSFDEHGSDVALSQAFAIFPPEQVCVELLQKGLAEIGSGWYEGTTSVQQEHFASELAMRRLETLVAATPTPNRAGRILVACPPGEEHTFSPLLLTLLLRRNGWGVVYLGANVPTDRLEATLIATQARLVVFSAQQLHTAATLLSTFPVLASRQVPLAYGGRIFNHLPELRERIPGYYLGSSLESAVEVVDKAMNVPYIRPAVKPISEAYQEALNLFRQRQAAIESEVSQDMQASDMPYGTIVNAHTYLSRNLIAALELGDISFLGSEIDWVEGLLLNYNVDKAALPDYLRAYYQAARKHLGEKAGQPILEWLAQFEANGRQPSGA